MNAKPSQPDGAPDGGPETAAFAAPSLEQLTALVFEIASQLHVERMRRIALECALSSAGILDAADTLSPDQAALVHERGEAALTRSMAGLMRVMTESADPKVPLRAQSAPSRPPI
jgi:hypothetical protein